jgi:hypothetical protein
MMVQGRPLLDRPMVLCFDAHLLMFVSKHGECIETVFIHASMNVQSMCTAHAKGVATSRSYLTPLPFRGGHVSDCICIKYLRIFLCCRKPWRTVATV